VSEVAPSLAPPRRFGMLWYWVTLTLIALLVLVPLGVFVVSVVITETNGCVINEASVTPCMIGGSDWSSALEGMTIVGLVGMALGAAAAMMLFTLWVIVLVIHRMLWRRKSASHA